MDRVLLDQALGLPPNERVEFAQMIMASLNYEDDKIRQAWIAEVHKRMESYQDGKSKLVDFEAVFK